MSDKNLTTFLTEWGGQVKELIEPKQEKLTPEFYLGSKANPVEQIVCYESEERSLTGQSIEYIGDGELSFIASITRSGFESLSERLSIYVQDSVLFIKGLDDWADMYPYTGTCTITSSETDNYKAGEWIYPFSYKVYTV